MDGQRLNPALLILCFLAGFAGAFVFRFFQVRSTPSFVSKSSAFTLHPPIRALSGTLTQAQGDVQQFVRDAEDYQEATPGGMIRQGEAIATKTRSFATVSFAGKLALTLGANTELSFVNLLPQSLLLRQKSGKVDYALAQNQEYVSVRALHALIEIAPEETSIDVDGNTVTVTVIGGSAKIGIVDEENNTNIYELGAGGEAIIDDVRRTVRVKARGKVSTVLQRRDPARVH